MIEFRQKFNDKEHLEAEADVVLTVNNNHLDIYEITDYYKRFLRAIGYFEAAVEKIQILNDSDIEKKSLTE